MTAEPAAPRPRQVTLAAALVMAGSVLLVASVFERLGELRSLESRTAIQRFLSEPPGSDLGLGTEAVIDILRTLSMVAAGIATATAILGYHVLKRNRSARVALSVLAVPLFLTGLASGGFLASVVAASVALLWLQPSRAWFTGTMPDRPPRHPSPPPPIAPVDGPVSPPSLPPSPPPAGTSTPPPWTAYGAPVPRPQPAQPARTSRPSAVIVACALTWTCCAFTALMSLLLMGVLVADADGLFAEMYRQNPSLADDGLSDATLTSMTWAIAIICLLWAVVSGGLAVLAYQRVRWAATSLVVSAALVALVCLGGSLVSPVLAVPGVLAAVVSVLLLQSGSQRWLARHGEHRGPVA